MSRLLDPWLPCRCGKCVFCWPRITTINQRVALGNLRKLGYDADVANNGIEVLNALGKQRYDIILMDCQMPEWTGTK